MSEYDEIKENEVDGTSGEEYLELDPKRSNNLTLAVPYDLRVCVAPKEQVCHKGFSENKGCHFGVRFIVKNPIKRMLYGFFLATFIVVLVKM